MSPEELRNDISSNNIEKAINKLLRYSKEYLLNFNNDIIITSSRYHDVKAKELKGIISLSDFQLELNLIRKRILDIIEMIEELNGAKVRKKSVIKLNEEIQKLETEFNEVSHKTENRVLRLQMKNSITKEIGKLFFQYPSEIKAYSLTNSNGIISGICRKIQINPDYGDLDLLENLINNSSSKFVYGNIANAILEIIYTYKLRLGDDKKIKLILNKLKINADKPLEKNVESVEAALEFIMK